VNEKEFFISLGTQFKGGISVLFEKGKGEILD
jgi:hypothetical protein